MVGGGHPGSEWGGVTSPEGWSLPGEEGVWPGGRVLAHSGGSAPEVVWPRGGGGLLNKYA